MCSGHSPAILFFLIFLSLPLVSLLFASLTSFLSRGHAFSSDPLRAPHTPPFPAHLSVSFILPSTSVSLCLFCRWRRQRSGLRWASLTSVQPGEEQNGSFKIWGGRKGLLAAWWRKFTEISGRRWNKSWSSIFLSHLIQSFVQYNMFILMTVSDLTDLMFAESSAAIFPYRGLAEPFFFQVTVHYGWFYLARCSYLTFTSEEKRIHIYRSLCICEARLV